MIYPISNIENAIVRRVLLALHVPVILWGVVVQTAYGAANAARALFDTAVATAHSVMLGAINATVKAVNVLFGHVRDGINSAAVAVRDAWRGPAKLIDEAEAAAKGLKAALDNSSTVS